MITHNKREHIVYTTFLFVFIMLTTVFTAHAADIDTHGSLLLNYAGRTTGESPAHDNSDFMLGEERLHLDVSIWAKDIEASARFKGDLLHDALSDETDLDVRELYIDYTTGDFDIRLGRQIATWGVGDLLFINDFFPKDWVSFFSGRSLDYLKVGMDSARIRYSGDTLSTEFILVPFFTPDTMPGSERFFLYDPLNSITSRNETEPASTYENTELALRIYRSIGEFDLAVYLYKGFWRSPSMSPDDPVTPSQVTLVYPELHIYGLSAQGNVFGGVLSLETGYYDSPQDRTGNDIVIPNSQSRFLIGYQRQLKRDFTIGMQYYAEIMENYGAYQQSVPIGFAQKNRYRDTITLRIEQLLSHQTLRLSLFTFYSPIDEDYLMQPQISYKLSDELSATLGANLFGGEQESTFLGQFDKNDNVYISGRFDF